MPERKGFAVLIETNPDLQKEISSSGGTAAQESGKIKHFDSKTGAKAGRKGGKTVSKNREWMSQIAKKGVEARRKKKEQQEKQKVITSTSSGKPS